MDATMFPWRMYMLPPHAYGRVGDRWWAREDYSSLRTNQIGRGQKWLKCFSAICQWRGETDWSTSASLLQFSYCPSCSCRDTEPPPCCPPATLHKHSSHAMTPWCAILLLHLEVNGQHWRFQNTSFHFFSPMSSCTCEIGVVCYSADSECTSSELRTEHGAATRTLHCSRVTHAAVPQRDVYGPVRLPGNIIIIYVTGCFC